MTVIQDPERTEPCPRGGDHDWKYSSSEDDTTVTLTTTCGKCGETSSTTTRK